MTFRALAILVTLSGLLVGLAMVVADPGILPLLAGKVAEGGMWTALALFVPVAAVLGCWPRDGAGRLRGPSARRR